MSELEVSSEFIEENKKNLGQFMPKHRKPGPYSKKEKEERRNEAYRLHFEYGYSARKIADLMKINRNTINGDLDYWYSKIIKNNNVFDPEYSIIVSLQRLETQRSRLREQLDKTDSFSEKLSLERLIFDIDSKIMYTYQRLTDSTKRIFDVSAERMNEWFKKNRKDERYMTLSDKISVSKNAREKIDRIINQDKSKRRGI